LLVAHQTFAEHGYGGSSINEIARLARISKPTLYARFPSKVALFRAIIEHQVANFTSSHQLPLPGDSTSLEEKLRAYANASLAASLSGDILQTSKLIFGESSRFPELADAVEERFRVSERQIAQILKDDIARTKKPYQNPDEAASLLNLLLDGWYSGVVVTNRVVTPAERKRFVDRAIRMFMAALPSL
jgi:AcrR family transcriptional regulator